MRREDRTRTHEDDNANAFYRFLGHVRAMEIIRSGESEISNTLQSLTISGSTIRDLEYYRTVIFCIAIPLDEPRHESLVRQ